MRFCTKTLGCKVNQYETQAIENILTKRGFKLVNPSEGCDVCIINTCAVTEESLRKSRQAIRRMKKLEPKALIAVCGCYSQLENKEIIELGVDLISGASDREQFASQVEKLATAPSQTAAPSLAITPSQTAAPSLTTTCEKRSLFEELPPGGASNRTRGLLKIQDGCDNYCAYCIVPYARGNSRSLPLDRMAEYAKQLDEQGYKEIVITGIEISSFTPSLAGAIQTIQTAAPKTRLRLGSLDPAFMTEELCTTLSKIPNICNHFHLSLQSGCDETLLRMGRKYNTNGASKAIEALRNNFPNCGITADLITGFPGETDNEFDLTLQYIKKAAFSAMHIFPFSPRPGTKAADMPGQVIKSLRKERARAAIETANTMTQDFKRKQLGKTARVLFEQEKNSYRVGFSENYIEIYVKDKAERNSIHDVLIKGIKNGMVTGEIQVTGEKI